MVQEKMQRIRSDLTLEHKVAFILVMVLGVGGIIFGFLSFGANLRRPFDLQIAKNRGDGEFLTYEQQQAKEIEDQKNRDTDNDGLSDYDEAYVYKTSAYLADSDSDGFDDKTEIFSNNDPNCPIGKSCNGVRASAEAAGNIEQTTLDAPSQDPLLGSYFVPDRPTPPEFSTPDDILSFFSSLTPEELRQGLLRAGVPQETLDEVDDETLMELAREAIQDAAQTDEINSILETFASQAEAPAF